MTYSRGEKWINFGVTPAGLGHLSSELMASMLSVHDAYKVCNQFEQLASAFAAIERNKFLSLVERGMKAAAAAATVVLVAVAAWFNGYTKG